VRLAGAACLLVAACALDESGEATPDAETDGPSNDVFVADVVEEADATPADVVEEEAAPPACKPDAPFANATNLGAINTPAGETSPSLTNDELTIFFQRAPDTTHSSLFYAQRASKTAPFGPAHPVTTISSAATYDVSPYVVDGMSALYFGSNRAQGGHVDLFQATGNGQPDGWSNPKPLTTLNETGTDTYDPFIASTGAIWLSSDRNGNDSDLYVTANVSTAPTAYTTLNTAYNELFPVLSSDALTVFFARTDSQPRFHVFSATRASTSQVFTSPQQVSDFDSGNSDNAPGWLSVDGCRMYLVSDRPGGQGSFDLWIATRGN